MMGFRGKYANYNKRKVKAEAFGHKWDSEFELTRYKELRFLAGVGLITDLECQPSFPLIVKQKKIGKYTADFRYKIASSGKIIVEDIKTVMTAGEAAFRLRIKLVDALHSVQVKITGPIKRKKQKPQ